MPHHTSPAVSDHLDFELPPELEAAEPPEHRGLSRDLVRLLVATESGTTHGRFRDLSSHLRADDVVVVNTSPTMPGALDGRLGRRPVTVHLSSRRHTPSGLVWEVEVRRPIPPTSHATRGRGRQAEPEPGGDSGARHQDGTGPVLDADAGDVLDLTAGGSVELLEPAGPAPRPAAAVDEMAATPGVRLWRARMQLPGPTVDHLHTHGRPIAYAHSPGPFPLRDHQTVFADLPLRLDGPDDIVHGASAEMASAGRPFTPLLVTDLVRRGVTVAPITLHAGVASLEDHEPPRPEPFRVPAATAELVNAAHARGGRVIAVGTTVTRALESATDDTGLVHARQGWTDLVLGPQRPARVVDGLVTGWHAPRASHLLLLQAVADTATIRRAYDQALTYGYLWHEFGDSCLLLAD